MRTRWFIAPAFAMAAALAACGGGTSISTVPQPQASAQQKHSDVTFVVTIPPKRKTATRSAQYITANVQGIEFAVYQKATPPPAGAVSNLAPDAGYAFFPVSPTSQYCYAPPLGGLVCNLPVQAAPGNDTFVVNTYDQPDVFYGGFISTGRLTWPISAGSNNTINITTSGIPTYFAMSIDNAYPSTPITQQVHILATDFDGNIIVGPYDAPLSLTNSDTSGITSLSNTTLNSSADAGAVTLGYSGGTVSGGATLTLSATSALAQEGTQPGYLHVNPQGNGLNAAPSFLEFVSPQDNPQTITVSAVGPATTPFVVDTNSDYWSDPSAQQGGSFGALANWGNSCQGIVTVSGSSPTFTITPVSAGICYLDLHDSANSSFGTVAINVNSSQPLIGATPAPQFAVTPAELSFTAAGQTGTFTASESGYSGSFTASSGNTNVATVSGSGPTFTVTAVAAGQALITVKDASGQIATVTASVTTTGIPAN